MSIHDGASATLVNGHERPIRMVKVAETEDDEIYNLTPDEAPVPVDKPGPDPTPHSGDIKRNPLLPAWAKSRTEAEVQAKGLAARVGHTAAYHGLRAPKYAANLTLLAPRGTARCIKGVVRWVVDAEGAPVRQDAVRRADAMEYMTLSRQRNDRVKLRAIIAAVAAFFGLATALTVYVLAPGWLYAFASLAILGLGYAGRPADKPLIGPAVVVPKAQRLTSEIVLRALGSLGISGINQAVAKSRPALRFTAEIHRDGPGWRAEGDLPDGVEATEIIEKRGKLAASMRRPLGCVWPEGVPEENPGRLVLWIGDEDMNKAKQPAWPFLKSGSVDLFKPAQIGTDQRGKPVNITLMFASMIIGAIPRMGKTFALRLLLLLAALDVRAELHGFDLKGTGDLSALERVFHAYRAGEEDEDIEYILNDFRALKQELRRRAKVIRSLPKDVCPENKVTPDLASNKSLRLHPIVIGVDECQVLFEHKEHGDELEAICTDLVKRGPALGIVLILATQRPDSKSLPTGISANAILRLCLKVMGQIENDMVLGTSSYKAGIRATTFTRSDRGIYYLAGEGDDPKITRGHYVDSPGAEAIAARARAMRELAGTLSGYCLDEEPEQYGAVHDLLDDILAVLHEDKAWSETVISRLISLRPAVYGDWTPKRLAYALRPLGVATDQVWATGLDGEGANRKGLIRADVATARDRKKGD